MTKIQTQLYGMQTQQDVLFRGLLVLKKNGVNVSLLLRYRLQGLNIFELGHAWHAVYR